MKINLFLFACFFLTLTINAQKVKIKKGTVYIDKKEFLKIDDEFGNDVVMTTDNKIIFTLKEYSFDVPNPARNNANDPNRFKYPATLKRYYLVVSFLNIELQYETDLGKKKFFKALYKYNLLDDSNKVIEKNARMVGQLISKEISGTIPTVLIRN